MSIRELTTAASMTAGEVRVAANVAAHAEAVLRAVEDEHGADEARAIRARLASPRLRIVVAGEYQQGKSSLINALLGARVTPTEPLATTGTPVRISWGREVTWSAYLAPEGEDRQAERRRIDPAGVDRLVTATPPTLDGRIVTAVEVTLDHPLLRSGVTLIDTPCVGGGLSTRTAGLVLGLLQSADGLLFVSDAGQELTAPELEFLAMARGLCPALVVALSKTDIYADWRRILDIDQEHVAAVHPDAVVLPVSAQMRAAAVRWGDAELDRASGLPLVTWYLGTTMLARARRDAVAHAASALGTRLAATTRVVEDRLAVLDRSTGRYRTARRYEEVAGHVDRLRSEAPKRVRLELRAFARSAAADLNSRFSAANDMITELVKSVDPADRWSEIEATLHRSTNRALAEHITYVRGRADGVVAELREAFGVAHDRLTVELGETGAVPGLVPDLDDLDFSTSRANKAHDLMRGAAGTGFMGVGLATMVVTGGVAALVLGAGASLSTVVLTLRRDRTRELEARRAKALQACRSWIADARAALTEYADDLYKELEFRLESQIEKGLRSLLEERETERARLDALRRVAADKVPEEVRRAQGQVDRLKLVHAHARRLHHRLARPELQAATR